MKKGFSGSSHGKSSGGHSQEKDNARKNLDGLSSLRGFTGIVDSKGELQFASNAQVRELGYEEDDILRKPFWEVGWFAQSPESQERIRDGILSAAAGDGVRCQVEALARDGTRIPVIFDINPLRGKDSDVVSIVAEADLLVEEREAEGLRPSGERLASLFNFMHEAYFEVDVRDRFTVISPFGARLLGYGSPEELLSTRMAQLWADFEQRDGFIMELSKKGSVRKYEAFFLRKDGTEVMVEIDACLLYDCMGEVIGSEGIFRDTAERKTYERELGEARTAQERFSIIAEEAKDGIIIIKDLKVAFANRRIYEMIGYLPAELELLGGSENIVKEFVVSALGSTGPGAAEATLESYQRLIAGKTEPDIIEMEICRKDGTLLPIEISASLIEYEGGAADLVIARDVSARKMAERERLEAEKRYRAIFDNRLHMVYIHDEQGCFVDANDFGVERLGYSREDLGKIFFQDVIYPDDIPAVFEAVQEVMTKGRMEHMMEIRLVSRSGEIFWIDCLSLLLSSDGDHFLAMGLARDITDRRRAEEKLRESEARYSVIVEEANDAVVIVKKGFDLVFANRRLYEITGYSCEEIELLRQRDDGIMEAMMMTLGGMDTGAVQEAIRGFERAINGQGIPRPTELEFTRKDGGILPVELSSSLIEYEEEPAVLILIRDITERRGAEQAQKASEERLKDLVEKLRLSQEDLSTPVVQVWDRVLALPLIGVVDSTRAQKVMEVLLPKIVETQAEVVVIDVTGVASMDTQVTNHLIRTIQSSRLLGTQCVVTGIRPEVAQAIVRLEMDMGDLVTMRDLQEGLRYALKLRGQQI